MGEITAISWCDHTFNPWIGCTKVSPACDGCYAEAMMDKRYGRVKWGAPGHGVGTRERTSKGNWSKPRAWDRRAATEGNRPFVFCSSLADVFDNQVPAEWRRDLFELIRATPHLVWLLLTKRPQLIVRLYEEAQRLNSDGTRWTSSLPPERAAWPANAAIGTTVEDQERANINVPSLLDAKAKLNPAFAFLSCEPLLGPIDLTDMDPKGNFHQYGAHGWSAIWKDNHIGRPWIDWVITGGETNQGGHKARPSHPGWFRAIRDQCDAAGVPYHHKQNGEWLGWGQVFDEGNGLVQNMISFGKDPERFQYLNDAIVSRVGKHRSGRLLDGVEHNARPEIAA